MIYGIPAGNKLHPSGVARSLKERITLKRTMDQLSKDLHAFDNTDSVMHNYPRLARQQAKDGYAIIIINNSDTAGPASRKPAVLSEIRDGSTGEITKKPVRGLPVYRTVQQGVRRPLAAQAARHLPGCLLKQPQTPEDGLLCPKGSCKSADQENLPCA